MLNVNRYVLLLQTKLDRSPEVKKGNQKAEYQNVASHSL